MIAKFCWILDYVVIDIYRTLMYKLENIKLYQIMIENLNSKLVANMFDWLSKRYDRELIANLNLTIAIKLCQLNLITKIKNSLLLSSAKSGCQLLTFRSIKRAYFFKLIRDNLAISNIFNDYKVR